MLDKRLSILNWQCTGILELTSGISEMVNIVEKHILSPISGLVAWWQILMITRRISDDVIKHAFYWFRPDFTENQHTGAHYIAVYRSLINKDHYWFSVIKSAKLQCKRHWPPQKNWWIIGRFFMATHSIMKSVTFCVSSICMRLQAVYVA